MSELNIAKLFASIGFKIDTKTLEDFDKKLTDIANRTINAFSNKAQGFVKTSMKLSRVIDKRVNRSIGKLNNEIKNVSKTVNKEGISSVEKLNKKTSELESNTAGAARKFTGLAAVVAFFSSMATGAVNVAVSMDNLNKVTGVSTNLLHQWKILAEQNNVSFDSVAGAIEAITKAQGELKAGRPISNAWNLLGVNPNDDPVKVLDNVLTKLGEIDDIYLRNQRLSDLGFSTNLVNLIGKRPGDLERQLAFSEGDIQILTDIKKIFTTLKQQGSQVSIGFAEALGGSANLLSRTINHLNFDFKAFGKEVNSLKLGSLVLGFASLASIFDKFTSLFFGFKLPKTVWLLWFALEDIYTWLKGGDSITKKVLEYAKKRVKDFQDLSEEEKKGVGEKAGAVAGGAIFGGLLGAWLRKQLTYGIASLGLSKHISSMSLIAEQGTIQAIRNASSGTGMLSKAGGLLTNPYLISGAIIGGLAYYNKKVWSEYFDLREGIREQQQTLGNMGYWNNFSPIPSINNNNSTSNRNVIINNANTFNVNGAKDPKAVANDIFGYQQQLNHSTLLNS